MAKPAVVRPPLPLVQAFLLCRETFRDERTKEVILVGPTGHIAATQFPARVPFSAFLQMTEGHGRYHLALSLRDAEDEEVWQWRAQSPLEHPNPLLPHQVVFGDLAMLVPRAGRYRLVLLANDEELAGLALVIGPLGAGR